MINILPNYHVLAVATFTCIQGLYLISLRWIRPDIARSEDILFGIFNIFTGAVYYFFNFRMDITTQLGIFLYSCVTFWYVNESIYLRKLIEQRNKDSVN